MGDVGKGAGVDQDGGLLQSLCETVGGGGVRMKCGRVVEDAVSAWWHKETGAGREGAERDLMASVCVILVSLPRDRISESCSVTKIPPPPTHTHTPA